MLFSDVSAENIENAKFVILGVPFDKTTSFRPGCRFAPQRIREASYALEDYIFEHDISFSDIPVYDNGDVQEFGTSIQIVECLENILKETKDKFIVLIGGEHTITIPAVKHLKSKTEFSVVILDAHLDFRDSYLNDRYSHACTTRRISEVVGISNVVVIGVRSMCREEMIDANTQNLKYVTVYEIYEYKNEIERIIEKTLNHNKIYLSLDMDCLDPAYAPGVGTPEPFGLSSIDIKKCINMLSDKLIGFDIVEVSPPFDNGNTSILSARLIREVIVTVWKSQTTKRL